MILIALAAQALVPSPGQVAATPVIAAAPSSVGSAAAPDPAPAARPGATVFLTARGLQEKCQESSAAMVSYCYAYIAGVNDAIRAYETWLNMREFCRPARVSQSDLRHAFLDYLTANPRAASGEAASVVVIALRTKYACDIPQPVAPAAP